MGVELTPKGTRGRRIPKVPTPVMRLVQTLLTSRVRRSGGSMLELTTTGAKSGRKHTVPLSYFGDGRDAWLVVASLGGSVQHPAWYFNMAKNPDKIWVTIKGRKRRVQAESLKGAERAAAWGRIVAVAPVYKGYQEQTDREIPVVRLTPAPETSA
jgi:deazaflavin-dependent oxidoreductase (nitroreductase family)